MAKLLIIASADLTPEFGNTVLWRRDIERVQAPTPAIGLEVVRRATPQLVVIDGRDPAAALDFMRRLREDPSTRRSALAVLSRSPTLADEETFRRAGANLVFAGEVDPSLWDSRLEELLNVPLRREARIPVHFEVWSRFAPEEEAFEGVALNVSVRGILLEADEPLDVGTQLELSFTLPGESADLHVVGRVVRDAGVNEGRPLSGIEFLILRGDARERIEAFVDRDARS